MVGAGPSTSVSLAMNVANWISRRPSSATAKLSSAATGASLTGVMVRSIRAVEVSSPSLTVTTS